MSGIEEDDIRNRAYALWEAAGKPEGSHETHWHQAREELQNLTAPPKGRIKVATSVKKPTATKTPKAKAPEKAAVGKSAVTDDAATAAAIKGRGKKASNPALTGTS